MPSLGDYSFASVVYGKFTTVRPSSGAPFTLAGTPALSVYKDNSTTQSTAGVTLTVNFDTVTGLNHFTVDTTADATFYSNNSNFDIVVTTGTVDGVSAVGQVISSFTIQKNSAKVTSLTTAAVDSISDGILDRTAGVETGLTVRQAFRLMSSALFGKASGLATSTAVFRDYADTKARITATVDADGNRSALTLDAS